MSDTVTLAATGWEATLLPALGGSIASLRYRGADILRPTPASADHPLDTASFPLVPYANRIAHGRFRVGGQTIALPHNFGDHPHALHGVGWLAAWQGAAETPDRATLTLTHRASDAWPWDFTAQQRFTLGADGLAVRLTLRNCDAQPIPAGLGFHPYFPAPPGTRLRARLQGAWLSDATQLPTARVADDHFGKWRTGDDVARAVLVDNTHDGWDGEAWIESGDRTIRLTAQGTRWLHLYMPPGEPFFCAEPVSHLPDAVNRDDQGMTVLAAGETLAIAMRIALA